VLDDFRPEDTGVSLGEGPRRGLDRGVRDAKLAGLHARELIDSLQLRRCERSWKADWGNRYSILTYEMERATTARVATAPSTHQRALGEGGKAWPRLLLIRR
jgi:hypothetical protein